MHEAWKVAAVRATLQAIVVGSAAALGVWATTDELKPIIVAGGTPALGILMVRLGVEGAIDSAKK